MRSVYKDLARILSPLLLWLGVGWMLFPNLAQRVSESVGEPFDASKAGTIAYPLSILCLVFAVLLFWWWHVTLPVKRPYFEERARELTYRCPYCGRKIGVDETCCPHCKKKIPR